MPSVEDLILATIPTAEAPTQPVVTSYQWMSMEFADKAPDATPERAAKVSVHLCPRLPDGTFYLPNRREVIISGPEGYDLIGFIMFNLRVEECEFAESVLALTGQGIVGMTFTEAAPFLAMHAEIKKALRIADAQGNENGGDAP